MGNRGVGNYCVETIGGKMSHGKLSWWKTVVWEIVVGSIFPKYGIILKDVWIWFGLQASPRAESA